MGFSSSVVFKVAGKYHHQVIQVVTFLGMSENVTQTQRLFRDLQRSGIKRLLLESPGRNILFGTTFLNKTSHAVCMHVCIYQNTIATKFHPAPSANGFLLFFSRSTRKPQQVHGENDDSRSTVVTMMISQ